MWPVFSMGEGFSIGRAPGPSRPTRSSEVASFHLLSRLTVFSRPGGPTSLRGLEGPRLFLCLPLSFAHVTFLSGAWSVALAYMVLRLFLVLTAEVYGTFQLVD